MSTVRDLLIDPNTLELVIVNGDLALVSDINAIAQEIGIALRLFLGEWFLDETEGTPWFQQILGKHRKPESLVGLFAARVESCAGVNSVTSITLDYNGATRTLTVAYVCDTDLGQLTGAVPLRPGQS